MWIRVRVSENDSWSERFFDIRSFYFNWDFTSLCTLISQPFSMSIAMPSKIKMKLFSHPIEVAIVILIVQVYNLSQIPFPVPI